MPDHGGATVRLDPSWPGLQAPAQEVHVDPDTLERLGRLLAGEANGLASDASHLPAGYSYLDDARRSTTVGLRQATEMPAGAHWFGEWATAVKMEHILNVSQDSLGYYYQEMVNQLQAAGDLFKATAEAYRLVDQGAAVNLEQRLAGWDQLAAGQEAPAGRPAGHFQDAAALPRIDICEDATGHDPQTVLAWIEKVREKQPWWQLQGAGDAFGAVAERLAGLATKLRTYAESLSGEWASEGSVACQRALQRISATAEHLAETSGSMSSFAHRSAAALREAVSGFPTEVEGRSFGEWVEDAVTVGSDPNRENKANEVRDALTRLNNAYFATTHETVPPQVGADLPVLPATDKIEPPPPYLPPPAPTAPLPPTPMPVVGTGTAQTPPVGTGISGLPDPIGAGSGSTSGGLPGFVGVPAGQATPGEEDLSTSGGLAGAGFGSIGPGGLSPGGVGPGGAGPAAGGVGGPGVGGPGAGGPGVVGLVPGGSGTPGRSATSGRGVAGSGAAGRGGVGGWPVPPGVIAAGAGAGSQGSRADRRRGRAVGASGSGANRPRGGLAGQAAGAGGRPGAAGVMPIGAGSGTDRDNEKHGRHDSWLREDGDPWHGDDNVPPPVIR